jgi:UDP-3-O-[3-hydroxymyristoyl] glucosamine N-acyltransferase
LKLRDIASRLECALEGDGETEIRRIAAIEEAGPGDLTFFVNPKYAPHLRETRASAVILAERADAAAPAAVALLRTANPYLAFARAAEIFAPPPAIPQGVHRLACAAARSPRRRSRTSPSPRRTAPAGSSSTSIAIAR